MLWLLSIQCLSFVLETIHPCVLSWDIAHQLNGHFCLYKKHETSQENRGSWLVWVFLLEWLCKLLLIFLTWMFFCLNVHQWCFVRDGASMLLCWQEQWEAARFLCFSALVLFQAYPEGNRSLSICSHLTLTVGEGGIWSLQLEFQSCVQNRSMTDDKEGNTVRPKMDRYARWETWKRRHRGT